MKAAFVTLFLSLFSQLLFAHGMNKPGPNNGYIKMPGAYHIELVPAGNAYKVYFLDMAFKPLASDKSAVSMVLGKEKVKCAKEAESFTCYPKSEHKNLKELSVETSQKGERAATSKYQLPLSF